jgi:hypothetical protein
MAGKAGLFQKILNFASRNPDVARNALTSGALTTGLGMMGGLPAHEALAYGLADLGVSYPVTLGVRKLRPKPANKITNMKTGETRIQPGQSGLELPLNIGASVTSGLLLDRVLGGGAQNLMPTDVSQSQQVMQQNIQRDLLNTELAGYLAGRNAYVPGTMFQAQGLESTFMRDQLQEALQPQQFNLAGTAAVMGGIVGV